MGYTQEGPAKDSQGGIASQTSEPLDHETVTPSRKRKYPIYRPPRPEVDFLSSKFDPVLALTMPHVPVPCVAVRAKDSILQCRHFLDPSDENYRPPPPSTKPKGNSRMTKDGPADPELLRPLPSTAREGSGPIDESVKDTDETSRTANDVCAPDGRNEAKRSQESAGDGEGLEQGQKLGKPVPILEGLTTRVAYFPGILPRNFGPISPHTAVPGPTSLLGLYMGQEITVAVQGMMPKLKSADSYKQDPVGGVVSVYSDSTEWGCGALFRGTLEAHDAFGNIVLGRAKEVRWVPGRLVEDSSTNSSVDYAKLEAMETKSGILSQKEAEELLFFGMGSQDVASRSPSHQQLKSHVSTSSGPLSASQASPRAQTPATGSASGSPLSSTDHQHWSASLTGVRARLYKKFQSQLNQSDRPQEGEDPAADKLSLLDDEPIQTRVGDRFATLCEGHGADGSMLESDLHEILRQSLSASLSSASLLTDSKLWVQRNRELDLIYIPNDSIILVTPSPKVNCGSGFVVPW